MTVVPFKQVDVFTSTNFKGNPVAVINLLDVDEQDIEDEKLQAIANWTNLSETTFLCKPSAGVNADYKLRIFEVSAELPFAGHPTVGSCQAFIEFTNSSKKEFVQECQAGLIPLRVQDDGTVGFQAVMTDIIDIADAQVAAFTDKVLKGLKPIAKPQLLNVGPKWVVYLVSDNELCFNADPDLAALAAVSREFGYEGLILAGKDPNDEKKYEMRAFAPASGVLEDPVCGSGSVALARFLQHHYSFDKTFNFTISQGGRLNRKGRIDVQIEHTADEIKYFVKGQAITIISGTISL